MRAVLVIISLCLSLTLHGQDHVLRGRIIDAETKEAVQVAVINSDLLELPATTDQDGAYQVVLPEGRHWIWVEAMGMETRSLVVELYKDVELDIYMVSSAEQLTAISVTERRATTGITRLKAVDGYGIYAAKKNEVIMLDDMTVNMVANTARQVFAKVPGLNIWESDFAGLQLDIAARGLGPSRTANFNTRQNGYDMSADALGYPESYYMPALQAVERIEVVRGAASLQYGTQFGGMLNFKLREAPDAPFELNAEQSVGSFGLTNSFVSLGGRKDKLDYYGYYQYRRGDGWRENAGFFAHTAFARVGYQVHKRMKVGLEYTFMDYEAQQPGGLTDAQFDEGDLEQSNRGRNWFSINWNLLAATMDYDISERTKLNLRAFGLFSQRDALGNLSQIGVPDDPRSDRTLIQDGFENIGAEVRLLHDYSLWGKSSAFVGGLRLYCGLTERRQGAADATNQPHFDFLNPDDLEAFDYDFPSQNQAIFIENLTDITDRLSMTLGLRLEHIRTQAEGMWKQNRFDFAGNLVSSVTNFDESSERRLFPLAGVGVNYKLSLKTDLYANYSGNFRSITFSDLRVVNPNYRLDSMITDENGFNADIGIRGVIAPWLTMDASLFYMRYNDRIGLYELPGSTTLLRTNIGNSRHVGLELLAEVDVLKVIRDNLKGSKLTWFVNLALTDAEYVEADITAIRGRRVEYVPQVMLRTGLSFRIRGFKASLQYSFVGEQYSDATNSDFNPNALTGRIPTYDIVDLSLSYKLRRYKFSAGMNNILDEAYFTRRAESYPGPGIIPATPRSVYASVGVRIGK